MLTASFNSSQWFIIIPSKTAIHWGYTPIFQTETQEFPEISRMWWSKPRDVLTACHCKAQPMETRFKKKIQKHPKTETTTFGTLKSPQIIEHWLFFKGTPFGGAAILWKTRVKLTTCVGWHRPDEAMIWIPRDGHLKGFQQNHGCCHEETK